MIPGIYRFHTLRRTEDTFTFASDDGLETPPAPDGQFLRILEEGPKVGIHVLAWIETPASLERAMDRASVRCFGYLALLQMRTGDPMQRIDTPEANHLGPYRVIYFQEDTGFLAQACQPVGGPDLTQGNPPA